MQLLVGSRPNKCELQFVKVALHVMLMAPGSDPSVCNRPSTVCMPINELNEQGHT